MRHGIDTTIVEIDPTVHKFASKYFALPTGHTKVIEDAVSYASNLAKKGTKYDYIVHDVFTGGAEPVDLFTFEFLSDLHAILKPGGIIAIVRSLTSPLFSIPLRFASRRPPSLPCPLVTPYQISYDVNNKNHRITQATSSFPPPI